MTVTVRPVLTPADRREFLRVPDVVYRGTQRLRRPRDIRRLVTLSSGISTAYFLAERAGAVVGRVCASDAFGPVGRMGLFECVPDEAVAKPLLTVAQDWLWTRGLETVVGPLDPARVVAGGVLVDGLAHANAEQTSFTAPWHGDLLVACGWSELARFHTWRIGEGLPKQLRQISNAVQHKAGLRVETLSHLSDPLEVLARLYNAAYVDTFGFVALTPTDLEQSFGGIEAFDGNLSLVAFVHDEPAGFGLVLPERTLPVRGVPEENWSLGATARRLLHERLRRSESGRIPLFGVVPKFRGSALGGLSMHLYVRMVEAMQAVGMNHAELTWTPADDDITSAGLRLIGAKPSHAYAIYGIQR